ncbi:hypothetical protein INR49_018479, partial [Caranx melampygus]
MNGKRTLWEVDGSMVPAEWHRWLHCMTDDPPTTHPPEPKKFLAEVHQFNVSGSSAQYVPYSTTRKKIHEWVPPKAGTHLEEEEEEEEGEEGHIKGLSSAEKCRDGSIISLDVRFHSLSILDW